MRASTRRMLARGARRVRHGSPALSVVVLAAGGDPGRLHRTISSVRAQPSPAIEIVVVGVGSGLDEAREAAGPDTRVRLFSADSVPEARVTGVRRSRGLHVLVASPGDVYSPGALADLTADLPADETLRLSASDAPGPPTTLAQAPVAAGLPFLGTLVVPRPRALAVFGALRDDDPDGLLLALQLLRDEFRPAGWATYRNVRDAPLGPFLSRPDPFPALPARVERDLVTLASLSHLPAARAARARGALDQLRGFLEVADQADEDDWAVLAQHAADLREHTRDERGRVDLADLPVVTRVLALLAADGLREDLLDLLPRIAADLPTSVRDGQVYTDLGLPDGLLPADALLVGPGESPLVARAHRLRVDGTLVTLELMVGVRHVQQHAGDTVAVDLLHDGAVRPATTSLHADVAVDQWMGEGLHDHRDGLVRVLVDVGALPAGMHLLGVTWSDGDLTRSALVGEIDSTGSAARRPVALPDGRSVGLHLRHGLVALGVTAADAAADEVVRRVEVTADSLLLTVDPSVDAVRLEGRGQRVSGTPGAAGFWTVPLVADVWGLGEAPLPTGGYRLVVERDGRTVPAPAGAALLDRLPEEVVTTRHRVRLERGGGDRVHVQLEPLLADDERSRRGQRLLQAEYRLVEAPPDDRLVYFQSFTGQAANDNPLAIQAELVRRRPDLDVRWVVADSSATVPAGSRPLLFRSREWYDVMTRAGYLVTNIELERWYARRPGQEVLQTFHGYPSKAMGLGLWLPRGLSPIQVERQLEHTSRVWNALVTPAPEMDRYYRRDYDYDGRILATGYPRNDALVGPGQVELRRQTRQRLGIRPEQQAILYAPTWRDDLATNFRAARAVHHLDVAAAAEALGDEYVLLLRGHRFHTPGQSGSRVIDVTGYPDANHLMAAADAAVLDYSSLRFDFALTGRPMVFLVPDLDTYGSTTRGFLWDYRETAPGPLVATTADVVAELADLGALAARHAAELLAFNARYNHLHDGHAAERVVDEFFAPLLS